MWHPIQLPNYMDCLISLFPKQSTLRGTFAFSNCHIIGLDTGNLVLIVFGPKNTFVLALDSATQRW
jgi:hypothetical protein